MTSVTRGRPQASSRETLADAACELFLEQGYEATTVAHITKRAGVSRSSFFNYFDGKAATIWFALDEHLERFAQRVAGREASIHPAFNALTHDLGEAPPHTLALAITNADVMGVTEELRTQRAVRQAGFAGSVAGALRAQRGVGAVRAEIDGAAYAAAVFAAIWGWADRGAGASRLDSAVDSAINTVEAVLHRDCDRNQGPLRVAVIGHGAIGARVIAELVSGNVPGAVLAGVVTRRPDALQELNELSKSHAGLTDFGQDLDRAIAESDLVVECAGIAALREYGPRIIRAGRDLATVSIGALADPEVRAILQGGPGVLRLSSGAIGGLDLLAAAARPGGIAGGIARASISSTKRAATLVQPWMSEAEAAALRTTAEPFELFAGSVAEAVAKYPGSLNVACAVANATGLWEETRVTLVADPHAARTVHEIEASGNAGSYAFRIENAVSPANPTSSLIVAEAVLSEITALAQSALRS